MKLRVRQTQDSLKSSDPSHEDPHKDSWIMDKRHRRFMGTGCWALVCVFRNKLPLQVRHSSSVALFNELFETALIRKYQLSLSSFL